MMGRPTLESVPRLLPAPDAARYIGISGNYLRTLGLLRRVLGKCRLHERYDLDAFVSSMEIEGGDVDTLEKDIGECGKLFGAGS
ncbi:DNA-binding protein [Paracoccus sp. ME4]|uniref:DNA-binding protein n=1 Tax=Paracoccus sp. ME4 TaxID=3138066 RepID=UPI00398B7633